MTLPQLLDELERLEVGVANAEQAFREYDSLSNEGARWRLRNGLLAALRSAAPRLIAAARLAARAGEELREHERISGHDHRLYPALAALVRLTEGT